MNKAQTEPVVAAGGNWHYHDEHKPTEGGTYLVRCANRATSWYDVAQWNGVHWSRNGVTHWARLFNPMGEPV